MEPTAQLKSRSEVRWVANDQFISSILARYVNRAAEEVLAVTQGQEEVGIALRAGVSREFVEFQRAQTSSLSVSQRELLNCQERLVFSLLTPKGSQERAEQSLAAAMWALGPSNTPADFNLLTTLLRKGTAKTFCPEKGTPCWRLNWGAIAIQSLYEDDILKVAAAFTKITPERRNYVLTALADVIRESPDAGLAARTNSLYMRLSKIESERLSINQAFRMELSKTYLNASVLYRHGVVQGAAKQLEEITRRAEQQFLNKDSALEKRTLESAFELAGDISSALAFQLPEQLRALRSLSIRCNRLRLSENLKHKLLFNELLGAARAGSYLKEGLPARNAIHQLASEERRRFNDSFSKELKKLDIDANTLLGAPGLTAASRAALTWHNQISISASLGLSLASTIIAVPIAPLTGGNPVISTAVVYNLLRATETVISDGDKIVDAALSGIAPPTTYIEDAFAVGSTVLDICPLYRLLPKGTVVRMLALRSLSVP